MTASEGVSRPIRWLILLACVLLWAALQVIGPIHHRATHEVGVDLPFGWVQDADHRLTLESFLSLPDTALQWHDRPLAEGFSDATYWLRFVAPAQAFDEGELWFEIQPVFVDHVQIFWRPLGVDGVWHQRAVGDRDATRPHDTDIDFRLPVVRIPPPPVASPGYEFVLRVRSTSSIMLEPSFWTPDAFAAYAAGSAAFWSFYFGMSVLASFVALLLAATLRSRLLWSVLPFSLSFLLVACLEGFVGWGGSAWRMTLQHGLTGLLALWAYPTLLWLFAEVLELRRHFPRVYRLTLAGIVVGLLMPLSMPLGFYGAAVEFVTLLVALTAPLILVCSVVLWWRSRLDLFNLVFALVPLAYVLGGMMAEFTVTALIPYDPWIYQMWKYSVLVHLMLTVLLVLVLGVFRIRRDQQMHLQGEQLAHDLRVEREARFQQRQFMGMISHEFRTPLAVISGAIQNLRALGAPDAFAARRYDKIERANQRLIQLTDNCLADARLSAGTLYVDRQAVRLFDVVKDAASLVDLVDDRRLTLVWQGTERRGGLDEPTEAPVCVDAALLRIAISNLLDNAVKFSPAGTPIRLAVEQKDALVSVTVSDAGPGIPQSQLAQIFERYAQAGTANVAPGPAGWGLGLFVARQIARAHGGDLHVLATSANGSSFELTVAVDPLPQEAAHGP